MVLENNLTFTKGVNRQYDSKFGVEGAKIGTVLNVRKPPRYVGRTGTAIGIEDATETQVAVTLDTQFGVDIQFTSEDLALKIDDFSKRFITPAVATIANKIDNDGLGLYTSVYNAVGVPGTTPNALVTYLSAGVKLDDNAAPMDGGRTVCLTPLMQATIVDALKGLFQQSSAIASQYQRGQMGTAVGFEWYMDQNVNTHTSGVFTTSATPLVNGSTSTGATTVVTDGWNSGSSTVKKGDVFTLAAVNHVNPQSRQSTGTLQQFVVTANTTSSGGAMTIPIDPAIKTTTAFQTVDALPADNAALTFLGPESTQSPTGVAHHTEGEIAILDLDRGGAVRLSEGAPAYTPAWSPDGSVVTYSAVRETTINLYSRPADFSGPEELLLESPESLIAGGWSSGGQTFVYYQTTGATNRDIWALLSNGEPTPVRATEFNELAPSVSPDGHWVAFVSNQDGRDRVYMQPLGGGRLVPVSTGPGNEPIWSRDGRELFYRDGTRMMVVEVAPGLNATVGTPQLLFEGTFRTDPNSVGIANYDVAPDGQSFIMVTISQSEESTPTIVLVDNWFEELKARVPVP